LTYEWQKDGITIPDEQNQIILKLQAIMQIQDYINALLQEDVVFDIERS